MTPRQAKTLAGRVAAAVLTMAVLAGVVVALIYLAYRGSASEKHMFKGSPSAGASSPI